MREAFHLAFKNYPVRFHLSEEQFHSRFVQKLHIDYEHSIGAFDQGRLVGFIFVAISEYQGQLTCYNGGTGVVPEYQGKGLSRTIYKEVSKGVVTLGVRRHLLEVITDNQRAVTAYQKYGFEMSRLFHCYQLRDELRPVDPDQQLSIRKAVVQRMPEYMKFQDTEASFIDSNHHLHHHIARETILEAHYQGHLAGYLIFQPEFGRISQMAVAPAFRRKGIGTALLEKARQMSIQKNLTILNIEEKEEGIAQFYTSNGFVRMLSQHEMVLPLA